jgi:hypothetical protein
MAGTISLLIELKGNQGRNSKQEKTITIGLVTVAIKG